MYLFILNIFNKLKSFDLSTLITVEPGYQGSGGYAQPIGPPLPSGGNYGHGGYHQPRPSGASYASAQAVAGAYGGGGGRVTGGY